VQQHSDIHLRLTLIYYANCFDTDQINTAYP